MSAVAVVPPVVLKGLADRLGELLVGQAHAIDAIVPFVQMYRSGLAPRSRPVGTIMLLGPTGTGKTRTVEALAEVMHGSSASLLRVDCGEFQSDHEIAKLIGSPPGYLGHKETVPILSQNGLNAATGKDGLTLLLFDEIEKSSPALTRLLLGILDKSRLRLGDNTAVSFDNCLIFMTSNLGSKEIENANNPKFGLESLVKKASGSLGLSTRTQSIGLAALRRKFTPEFVNRLDAVITYKLLDETACCLILNQMFEKFSDLIKEKLIEKAFNLRYTDAAHMALLEQGTSIDFGARELRRVFERNLVQPVAAMVADRKIKPGRTVNLNWSNGKFEIELS